MAAILTAMAAGEVIQMPMKTFTLENGLEVVLVPRHETPIIHSLIRYKVGSANETVGITGISHVLEHMMFKGTKEIQTLNYDLEVPLMEKQDELFAEVLRLRRLKVQGRAPSDADQRIEVLLLKIKGLAASQKLVTVQNDLDVATFQVGFARLGADTSFDRTHYMEYFPSNCLEAWAYFESARMREPIFREFHSERDVVLEERRQSTETQPEAVLFENFLATAFLAHSYNWDVIGWRSDLENLTRRDVAEYHRLYYAPNNAILVLVGDFQPDQAEALIHRYFGKIPEQAIPKPIALTAEPLQLGERRIKVSQDATPRLIVGFHRCAVTHPDYPVLEIIDTILSQGRTSLFHKELIRTGLAADVRTGIWEMKRYPGLFSVTAVAGDGVELVRLETAILSLLDKLKEQPVTRRELEEARSFLTGRLMRQLRDGEGLAVVLAEGQDFFSDAAAFNLYLSRLQSIDTADIQRVAREWFVAGNRTVAWMVPPTEERSAR
jgi:predicted Zn-dependent peptidase